MNTNLNTQIISKTFTINGQTYDFEGTESDFFKLVDQLSTKEETIVSKTFTLEGRTIMFEGTEEDYHKLVTQLSTPEAEEVEKAAEAEEIENLDSVIFKADRQNAAAVLERCKINIKSIVTTLVLSTITASLGIGLGL